MIDRTIANAYLDFEKERGRLPQTEADHAEIDAAIEKRRAARREKEDAELLEQKRLEAENKIECAVLVDGKEACDDLLCFLRRGVHKKSFDAVQSAISRLEDSADAETIRRALSNALGEKAAPFTASASNIRGDLFCVIAAMGEPWKNDFWEAKSAFCLEVQNAAEKCLPPNGKSAIFYCETLRGKPIRLERLHFNGESDEQN